MKSEFVTAAFTSVGCTKSTGHQVLFWSPAFDVLPDQRVPFGRNAQALIAHELTHVYLLAIYDESHDDIKPTDRGWHLRQKIPPDHEIKVEELLLNEWAVFECFEVNQHPDVYEQIHELEDRWCKLAGIRSASRIETAEETFEEM